MTLAGALVLVAALGPEQSLTPQDRLWLASVDHQITKRERKEYAVLSEAERRTFRDSFWPFVDENKTNRDGLLNDELKPLQRAH
jgi:hypothetical protein